MDLIFPPSARISRVQMDLVSNTAAARSIFTGAVRTLGRAGDRMRIGLSTENASDRESYSTRAALKALRAACRGMANRVWLAIPSDQRRGSFPATELLTNNTFQNGTTGWTAGGEHSISVQDRILRVRRAAVTSGSGEITGTAASVLQYAPYISRHFAMPGRGSFTNVASVWSGVGSGEFGVPGHTYRVAVALTTSITAGISDGQTTDIIAGDYFLVPYVSLSRCALIDNGPNALLRSDELDNAAWAKSGATIAANADAAPNGISAADDLIEDTSTGVHQILQTATRASAIEDLCAYGFFRRSGGVRDVEITIDDGAGNGGRATFNLGTGVVSGSANNGSGTNTRPFVESAGNSYYFCGVIARCPASATIRTFAHMVNSGATSYTGDGTSRIRLWRYGAARSSVATRGSQTEPTALPTGTAQTGSALHLKGLPASTNGLLLPGDPFEIHTSGLHRATAALNSDAAGLGYLQFEPALRKSTLADNTPIIIHNPMARCVLTENVGGWDDRPGQLSDFEFVFEESLDA